MAVRILRAGAFTTVQDLGRHGWQRDGVPVSGAMDDVAARLANRLVGNADGAAVLEATLTGPAIELLDDRVVAVTGADMRATLEGRPLPPWFARRARGGDVLALEGARTGCRAYVALAGGIDIPPVLGSRCTYTRAQLGGLHGRPLRDGDVLPLGAASIGDATGGRGVVAGWSWGARDVVRVLPGPHLTRLRPGSRRALFGEAWTLAPHSDRMGLRFHGEPLALEEATEVRSAGVAMGTVQLPPDGQPIVLMADRQTTGGYPRLGEVATVDLPRLAQLRPGEAVRFQEITIGEAERLLLERERELARLGCFLAWPR